MIERCGNNQIVSCGESLSGRGHTNLSNKTDILS